MLVWDTGTDCKVISRVPLFTTLLSYDNPNDLNITLKLLPITQLLDTRGESQN